MKEVFANVFKLSNTLQVYLDQGLKKDGLTSKQMFLMIVIGSFDSNPSFKEAAGRSGTSYQNVKQIALKLEKQGFVHIMSDDDDKRCKRLALTDKARTYWQERDSRDKLEMDLLFDGFNEEDLQIFLTYILRLMTNIEKRSS